MIAKKCLEQQQANNKINDILLMLKKQLTASKTKINNLYDYHLNKVLSQLQLKID